MDRSDFNNRRSFFEDASDIDRSISITGGSRSSTEENSTISQSIMALPLTNSDVASSRAVSLSNNVAISKLNPIQLREMRDAFQVLDRDHDGQVDPEDIAVMLSSLGLDADEAALAAFFPRDAPKSLNLPAFLTIIAELLEPFSSSTELENALVAFDEDDSGQIDLADLREALVHPAPEDGSDHLILTESEIDEVVRGFTSRSTLSRTPVSKRLVRGEVFRYEEFVSSITGATGTEG